MASLSQYGDSSGLSTSAQPSADGLDLAARHLEKLMGTDSNVGTLSDKLSAGGGLGVGGLSGLQDRDYPAAAATGPDAAALKLTTRVKRVPLPAELVEHFGHMQCSCDMGIFPEVSRAWLTIDSDIYVWKYEDGSDLAYFDGLSDTILSVGLVTPRPGILQPHIKHLLCLATPVEVVLLGVSFTSPTGAITDEMHLLPEPLFTLPTDGLHVKTLAGTANGRIFLGGKDGCLYEFAYRAEKGWWGHRTQKVNHSSSNLSWLVPGFLTGFAEEDPLVQIVVDSSRNVLYTRSDKGNVTLYDLGANGEATEKVTSMSAQKLVEDASKLAATVEINNLKPIVHLAPVTRQEDDTVHLVAVTGGGARLYISTRHPNESNATSRPYCLKLLHVRLPPGFAPSAPPQKPTKVHVAYCKSGLTLLASSPAEAADVLWLIWNGSLPATAPSLMECQSTVAVEGHVWAMEEVTPVTRLLDLYRNSYGGRDPPAAVVQHCSGAAFGRQLAVLSAQGALLLTVGRPVDCLRQLMIECGGPEAEAVRGYFGLQGPEQATATALVLATSSALVDRQVSDWAARALFLYGGEPRLVYAGSQVFGASSQQQQQGTFHYPPTGFQSPMAGSSSGGYIASPPQASFHPNLMSTPAPAALSPGYGGGYTTQINQSQQQQQPAEVQFSGRHNGLYLYLGRLLRPIWAVPLVCGPADQPLSQVSGPELEFIVGQLHELRQFLEKHAMVASGAGGESMMGPMSHLSQMQQRSHQDALLREKQSLNLLRQLVVQSTQVLGLWMVVVDHQVSLVISHLNNDKKNQLRQLLFRDMVVTAHGRDLASNLVDCLVQRYLGDSASTDAISSRLREVCPGLYRAEDAASSKAHELLLAAAQTNKAPDRERMVAEAVTIAKQIAASLRLDVLVSHLCTVHAYSSVVEICLAAAAQRDPQGLALHYYKSGENPHDTAGLNAFLARAECYRHCSYMLKRLLESSTSGPTSPSVPKSPGPPPAPDPAHLSPVQAAEWADRVFDQLIACEDPLLHTALYDWLIENKYTERLLNIRSPFIEDYLKMGTVQHPESVAMFDLLWKYYEKNRQYVAAAKILSKLSDKHSTELSLSHRVEYLSRAILCVKSGEAGVGGRAAGELLHHLEEKMEVARVQLMVQEAAVTIPQAANSLSRLDSDLLDITTLYQDWAEPYQMWECKLAIFACSGYHDPPLVENIWTRIIERELERLGTASGPTKMTALSKKIESLGRLYSGSSKYFPLEFLVRQLELLSCREGGDTAWVPVCLQAVGVDLTRLLDVYNRLYLAKEPIWLTAGDDLHILKVLCTLLNMFVKNASLVAFSDRRQFTVVCQDAVATYLGELYMRQSQETSVMVDAFREIQTMLDRM